MADITLKGAPVTTYGTLPAVGTAAPDFILTKTDLADVTLKNFTGKKIVLNIFPSIDTSVCAQSVRRFNAAASNSGGAAVLCISADIPYAHTRFCGAENLRDVIPLSTFRHPRFGEDYGVRIMDGTLAGLMSRCVVVVDVKGIVVYTQQVPDIAQEPNYDAALKALEK